MKGLYTDKECNSDNVKVCLLTRGLCLFELMTNLKNRVIMVIKNLIYLYFRTETPKLHFYKKQSVWFVSILCHYNIYF